MIKSILLATILALLSNPSFACPMQEELTIENLMDAKIIFLGKIEKYEILNEKRTAKLTFSVLKTFKGKENKEITVIWQNGNFGLPKNWSDYLQIFGKKKELVVGLIDPKEFMSVPNYYYLHTSDNAELLSYPWILQKICSNAFMFSETQENVSNDLREELKKRRWFNNKQD